MTLDGYLVPIYSTEFKVKNMDKVTREVSAATRQKYRENRLGKRWPAEIRAKMSASIKLAFTKPEIKAKIEPTMYKVGHKTPPDILAKRIASQTGSKRTPEQKARMSAAQRKMRDSRAVIYSKSSKKYKAWRKAILDKSNHECTRCGSKDKLHAHHIIKHNENLSLKFDLNNGICLCSSCHTKVHWEEDRKSAEQN